ncbi:hypothetical protein RhiirA4_426566 [Rhizophagus irregularis]|uniref:Serine-threonine/tyrosine-protein kinase catalytic domain-containing protein n=1 Tax=Rhizophagus irregularis TaxID=588596 RepID=A0A2I1H5I0_9GLOM|nr:hypothetical protein RhiirA4_426566 [Rhizophagus irregularis]
MWEISRGKPPDNSNIIFPIINIHKATVFGTPKEYENLYRKCWNQESKQRPTINEILDEFKKMGFVNDVTSKLVKDNVNLTSQSQASDESFEYIQSFSSLHGMMFWLRHDLDDLGCIPLYS